MTKKRKDENASAGDTPVEERVPVAIPAESKKSLEPRAVELWREVKKTPAWLFAAAKTLRRWAHGKVVSEADFDAAIRDAGAVKLTSPTVRTR